jgi:hypothetical protein
MDTGVFSQGLERPGREADQSLPYSIEVKNGGTIPPPSTSLHSVMLN